jgi:hypothetical protein
VLQIVPFLNALLPIDSLAHAHVVVFFVLLEVLRIYRQIRKRVAAHHWEVDAFFLLLVFFNQHETELWRIYQIT